MFFFKKRNVGLGFFSEHFALEFLPKEKDGQTLLRAAAPCSQKRKRKDQDLSKTPDFRASNPTTQWSRSCLTLVVGPLKVWQDCCLDFNDLDQRLLREDLVFQSSKMSMTARKHIAEIHENWGPGKQALGRGGSAQNHPPAAQDHRHLQAAQDEAAVSWSGLPQARKLASLADQTLANFGKKIANGDFFLATEKIYSFVKNGRVWKRQPASPRFRPESRWTDPLSGEGVVSSHSVVATGLVLRHGSEFGTWRAARF